MFDTLCIWGFLILSAMVMLIVFLRQKVLVRGVLFSIISGLGSLFVISLLSQSLELGVTFNLYSAYFSSIYGIPGVIGLLTMQLIGK